MLLLLLVFISPSSSLAKSIEPDHAYINVPVANVWVKPTLRKVDQPSAAKDANVQKWIKSLSYKDKLALVGKLDTQALVGTKVIIQERKGNWTRVLIPSQPTPRSKKGYSGWIPSKQLAKTKHYENQLHKPFALITAKTAYLYNDEQLRKQSKELSFNTRLPILKYSNGHALVIMPDGTSKWLKKNSFTTFKNKKAIPVPSGIDIVNTGKQFLNLPYLWGGMSGFGFDCSGFTYTMHEIHGITIPRDSSAQAKNGKAVKKKDLKPGDLLFFARNNGKGQVHHVAIYMGSGKMIHSPNTASTIRIDSISLRAYSKEYAGARRYVK